MPSHDEKVELCLICKNNDATAPYTLSGDSVMVCATCLTRLTVREALESRLIHILTLEDSGQYDEALACLDAIWEANRDRDDDHWLARGIAMHRCAILFSAGRYAENERACADWAKLGFKDVHDRWMYSFEAARTLDALGRPREGLAVVEDALRYRDPKYLPSVTLLLVPLAELSAKLGQPVDEKWRSIAKALAKRYRTELPIRDSLGEAILELKEMTRTLRPKFPHEWKLDEADEAFP